MEISEIKKKLIELGWGEQTLELAIRANFNCEYCGQSIIDSVDNFYSIQVEHIIPQQKGGNDNFDNLAIACKNCNFIKRNWDPRNKVPEHLQTRENLINVSKDYIHAKREVKRIKVEKIKRLVNELIRSL